VVPRKSNVNSITIDEIIYVVGGGGIISKEK
jgi:hypothetical protein